MLFLVDILQIWYYVLVNPAVSLSNHLSDLCQQDHIGGLTVKNEARFHPPGQLVGYLFKYVASLKRLRHQRRT